MEKTKKIRGDDPKLGKLKRGKGERVLTMDDGDYFWKTDTRGVYIRSPYGKRFGTLNCYSPITPYDVKEIILANMDKLK